jgi:uncharacterized integral membrane protein
VSSPPDNQLNYRSGREHAQDNLRAAKSNALRWSKSGAAWTAVIVCWLMLVLLIVVVLVRVLRFDPN